MQLSSLKTGKLTIRAVEPEIEIAGEARQFSDGAVGLIVKNRKQNGVKVGFVIAAESALSASATADEAYQASQAGQFGVLCTIETLKLGSAWIGIDHKHPRFSEIERPESPNFNYWLFNIDEQSA